MTPLPWPWQGRQPIDEWPGFPLLFPFAFHRPELLLTTVTIPFARSRTLGIAASTPTLSLLLLPPGVFALLSRLRPCFGHKIPSYSQPGRLCHSGACVCGIGRQGQLYISVSLAGCPEELAQMGQLAMATGTINTASIRAGVRAVGSAGQNRTVGRSNKARSTYQHAQQTSDRCTPQTWP